MEKYCHSLNLFSDKLFFSNLVEVVSWHVKKHPERSVIHFLADGETESNVLTYRMLDQKAKQIAARLQAFDTRDTRALLVFHNGIDFISAFFGCLYAGVCAVPVYPPQNRSAYLQRLEGIASDCGAACILSTSGYFSNVSEKLADFQTLGSATPIAVDALSESPISSETPAAKLPSLDADSLAFLQYTSGSTSAPKGVMVTHGNLLHNIGSMQNRFHHTHEDVIVSWLPMFHDMGLIGAVLQTICIGAKCITMSPANFLQRPMRWLEAISKYRGTSSYAPNFAYELCVSKAKPEDLAKLDLSSWTMALNGAEPIKPTTVESFKDTFAAAGFKADAAYPAYGLAEATLFVSGSEPLSSTHYVDVDIEQYNRHKKVRPVDVSSEQTPTKTRKLVSSGEPAPDNTVAIVDPDTLLACADGEVGEIWVSGGSIAQGYWQNPEKTTEIFKAQIQTDNSGANYMRTGDLGFIHEGHLYVSGRIKETLIIRGVNYYPQNIEEVVQSHIAAAKDSGGAAFSVEQQNSDKLVLVQEVERTWMRKVDPDALFQQARTTVAEEFGIALDTLVLIKPMTLPKTSSGKIQRTKAKQQFIDDELTVIARLEASDQVSQPVPSSSSADDAATSAAQPELSKQQQDLFALLKVLIAQQAGVAMAQIEPYQAITHYGLDSITLVELIESISTVCGVALDLNQVMEAEHLADITTQILALKNPEANGTQGSAQEAQSPVKKSQAEAAIAPLSANQLQMLMLHQKQPQSCAYNVPVCFSGQFDAAKLDSILTRLVAENAALRSKCFFQADVQQWQQKFQAPADSVLTQHPLADMTDAEVLAQLHQSMRMPFALERGENFRFELFHNATGQAWLLLNFHHIATDFISAQRFADALWESYFTGQAISVQSDKDYSDFIQWQQQLLDSEKGQSSHAYWQGKLQSSEAFIQWPSLGGETEARPEDLGTDGDSYEFQLDEIPSDMLTHCAKELKVTLNSLLLAGYQLFLRKLCHQAEFAIGITQSGRPNRGFQNTIGYFVEPSLFSAHLPEHQSFAELVQQTHKQMIKMMMCSGTAVDANTRAGQGAAYQTLFTFYPHKAGSLLPFNSHMSPTPVAGYDGVKLVPMPSPGAQLDLSLLMADDGEHIQCRFEYNSALFSRSSVQAFAGWFAQLLARVVANPESYSHQLYLQQHNNQHQQLLQGLELVDYRDHRPIHHIIAATAQAHPHKVALRFDGQSMDYAELERRATALAGAILERVPAQSVVGVFAQRSFDMVIALLASLKAGCAYVPITPELPGERIDYIVNCADVQLVLVQGDARLEALLDASGALENRPDNQSRDKTGPIKTLTLTPDLYRANSGTGNDANALPEVTEDDLAYVIFTSGSTGNPKGVMNTHGAIRNRLLWMQREYDINSDSRILQKTPFAFDVSVWEFFLPLMSGGTLVLAKPEGHKNPEYLHGYIAEEGVTELHFVPSMLDAYVSDPSTQLDSVNKVFCSGEALTADLVQRFFARYPHCELHNLYGPTEAAIDVSYWQCQPEDGRTRIPIGKPIANIELYVLDPEQQPVPPGVTGELYISGVGLARGYANRPELTAQSFLPNPFSSLPGARMYRTGDLVQYDEQGVIDYLGRIDNQVKIRGFRIELNEIDISLLKLSYIKQAVTLVTGEGSDKTLAAYLVFEADVKQPEIPHIKADLAAYLPEYMIPTFITPLEAMPVTANGKLDRKALPKPSVDLHQVPFEAPLPGREQQLAAIWGQVLNIDSNDISRHHHFFQLGGHSLSATKLAALCQGSLQAKLSVRDIFSTPLLAEQAQLLDALTSEQETIPRVARDQQQYPLSSEQSRIWFLDQFQGQGVVYNMPMALAISGALDTEALISSLSAIVARHEVLRTRYQHQDNVPYQVIDTPEPLMVDRLDISDLAPAQRDTAFFQAQQQHANQHFDLANAWPIRAQLVKESETRHTLLLCLHHIAADGWSLSVLLDELQRGYLSYGVAMDEGMAGSEGTALVSSAAAAQNSQPPLQYLDYLHWQQQWLNPERREQLEGYWRQQLDGLPPLLTLPTDKVRPARQSINGGYLPVEFSASQLASIKQLAHDTESSVFMVLLSAYQLLLSLYSGTCDIAVGTPVSGRSHAALDKVFGFFANTLVLRNQFTMDSSVADFIARAKEVTLEALEHQDLPFQDLLEALQPERNASQSPLFQVLFSLEHSRDLSQLLSPPGDSALTVAKRPFQHAVAKFDLSLMLEESSDNISGYFEYNADLFAPDTIARMRGHLQAIVTAFCALSDLQSITLAQVSYLSHEEIKQFQQWNSRAKPAEVSTIAECFRQQVQQAPHAIALRYQDQCLTYAELDQKTHALADCLQDHCLRANESVHQSPVALYLNNRLNAVIAMLAVAKCGAYYVPLDTQLPGERLLDIVEDVVPVAVLTDSDVDWLAEFSVIDVEGFDANFNKANSRQNSTANATEKPAEHPEIHGNATDLAYVMYTSGSTGKPKGVAIFQQGVTRLVIQPNYVDLCSKTVMLQAAPVAFDAATFEIWGALLNGAELVIYPEQVVTPDTLQSLVQQHGVNTAWLTASLFNHLIDLEPNCIAGIQQLLVGGDVLSVEHVTKAYQSNDELQIINGYGPTETTTFAACYRIPRDQISTAKGTVPIGFPVNGTQLYVLNQQQQQVPVGVVGELYIGGAGLARDYFQQPELTKERFIDLAPFMAPLGDTPNDLHQRLYRTGDQVRFLANGAIEFFGRSDDQVKLRGFRFQLKDVKNVLSSLPGIEKSAVVVQGTGQDKILIAYVTGSDVDTDEILQQLAHKLPTYMVPSFVLPLETLPLTRNGKLDRKALPDYRQFIAAEADGREKTPAEELMAQVWADLLGISAQQLGPNSHFFRLGGHSLMAAKLVAQCNALQAHPFTVREVFDTPELAQLAAKIPKDSGQSALPKPITPVTRQASHDLSFAQARLWFLAQMEQANAAYNVPLTLKFTPQEQALDLKVLSDSIVELVKRHEVLRTRYQMIAGQPQQLCASEATFVQDFTLEVVKLPSAQVESAIGEFNAMPFDLTQQWPIRGKIIRETATAGYDMASVEQGGKSGAKSGVTDRVWLLLNIHHIATDGGSMAIVLRELAALYATNQASAGSNNTADDATYRSESIPVLPPLPIQYLDFSEWQKGELQQDQQTALLSYWQNKLEGLPPKLDLPTDFPRPVNQSFAGHCYPVTLPQNLLQPLQVLCEQEGCSAYIALLTAFNVLLSKYSGEQDICVGTPVANRPAADLQSLVGFFANTLVLRNQVTGESTLLALLAQVKETALGAFEHQALPFEVLVEQLQPQRSLSYSPLFQVMFSLNHEEDLPRDFAGVSFERVEQAHNTAKFDLSLMLNQSQSESRAGISAGKSAEISGYIEYCTDLFTQDSIEALWQHYIHVLEQLLSDRHTQVQFVELDSRDNLQAVYEALVTPQVGNEASSHTNGSTLTQLFQQQVQATPDALALQASDTALSYQQLNQLADKLAAHLLTQGLLSTDQPGTAPCAVYLPRQSALLVSLLGIVKAGGFYVPLDPKYPAQRVVDILASAQPKVVITTAALQSQLPSVPNSTVVTIEAILAETTTAEVDLPQVPPEQAAYAIYTSGSTGKPKGIAISHQNATAMLHWGAQEYQPAQLAHVLAATSICFDLSVYELFLPLSVGGCVHLVEDILTLVQQAPDPRLTLINTVPSAIEELARMNKVPSSVATINLAGEPLSRKLVDTLYQLPQVKKVYNLYGPSEDTTYSTFKLIPEACGDKPSIGKPIAGTQAYVLDKGLNLMPVGVAGELYLTGAGVSLGYINDPIQTAAAYLPNPFSGMTGGRMYKTGDRVRLLKNGDLEYIGRIDHQVKVRGFRIELSEIEASLMRHNNIAEAIVVVSQAGTPQAAIVAYCTCKPAVAESADAATTDLSLDAEAEKQALLADVAGGLKAALPDYMQPAHILILDSFPALPNGKVDRKALANKAIAVPAVAAVSPPEGETEMALAKLWQELLGIPELDRHSNFFDLGGHSLLATQLFSRIHDDFNVTLSIKNIFAHPTLAEQANLVDLLRHAEFAADYLSQNTECDHEEEGAI